MRILIIGYGKMGKTIERLAINQGYEIGGIISKNHNGSFSDLASKCDVAIEFTDAQAAPENISNCINVGLPVVSGSTGWLDRYEDIVAEVNMHNGSFIYASNFSIGVNIFFEINRHLATMMNQHNNFDASVNETHHTEKKDKPSGTAITIANDIVNNISRLNRWNLDAKEQADDLVINSFREGKVFGDHDVVYSSESDRIEIKHVAKNRNGFASGAIVAAKWLIDKKGVYSMNDVLFS